MKCYEGTILTVNETDQVCRYLVEDKGRIVYVGDTLPQAYEQAERVELGERALIPAFVDSHQHFASFATFYAGLNVMDETSNAAILERVKDFAAQAKGKTLIAFGASPYSVEEGRLVTREELDSVCPDKEIMVVKYDGHACIINSLLLKKLDRKLRKLRGYHPDTGEMNQEAFFACSNYLSGSLSLPQLVKNMQAALDFQASRGIGSIHSVSGVGFPGDMDITLEKLFAQSLRNGFQLRIFPQSLNVKTAVKRGLPRIGGCFACALDGCFGSHDAALLEPYADEAGGQGVLYYTDEQVTRFCKEANRAGLQIELHAIGDQAFNQACRCLWAALDDYPREDHRHGIIHDCLPTQEGMRICGEYHIQMPVQTAFIGWRQEPDSYLESILGPERASRLNPLRTLLDHGIVLSAGSDGPCTTPDPISWIHRAVNHSNPGESISVQEALRMCTYNGYWTCFDEEERGSLEAGKVADMVILSRDPYTVPARELETIQAEQLLLKGKPYKSCRGSVLKTVLSGLISRRKA